MRFGANGMAVQVGTHGYETTGEELRGSRAANAEGYGSVVDEVPADVGECGEVREVRSPQSCRFCSRGRTD